MDPCLIFVWTDLERRAQDVDTMAAKLLLKQRYSSFGIIKSDVV